MNGKENFTVAEKNILEDYDRLVPGRAYVEYSGKVKNE